MRNRPYAVRRLVLSVKIVLTCDEYIGMWRGVVNNFADNIRYLIAKLIVKAMFVDNANDGWPAKQHFRVFDWKTALERTCWIFVLQKKMKMTTIRLKSTSIIAIAYSAAKSIFVARRTD